MKRLLALAAILLLVGCAAKSGQVTNKSWHPPYDVYGSTCVVRDKNGLCAMSVPNVQHYPEAYFFELDHGTWDRQVPKDIWNKYKIGDYFPGIGAG
jgi:hypothetical protein